MNKLQQLWIDAFGKYLALAIEPRFRDRNIGFGAGPLILFSALRIKVFL
jgi:hypothetical protein